MQEFDEKLIDCVHSFLVIYDPSKKSYKDRIAKVKAWKSIATVLERDGKFIVSSVSPTFI
jgi:citrate lyase synthetase